MPPDFAQRIAVSAALTRIAAEDPAVHRLMAEVYHLLRPPSALGEPELVARVGALLARA